MSTTPHIVAPEEIMAHLDGELTADRSHAVSIHIETCPECRNFSQELQKTKFNVALWQVAAVPASIENRIQSAASKVHASFDTSRPALFRRMSLWSWKQWLGAITATAAAILLFFAIKPQRMARESAPRQMSTDSARINSALRQQAGEPQANWADEGGYLSYQKAPTGSDSALHAYAPKPGFTLDKSKSDLQMGRATLQEKELKAVAGTTLAEPMIARTVSLSVVSKDFDTARASLDAILARHHGYAANLGANTPQGAARSIQASLRIPAPQLAAAIAELKSLGRVEVENQNGEEVTQQHADLVARLKNSRETEQRLQAILTQRTGKISDVLEVEQEIARVRGEIEQMEAEQKNLEHRVDFATIDLKLSEEYKAKLDSPTPSISTQLHNALVNGYRNVSDTLIALLLFFAEYGPILLFWALLLFIPAWLVWRRLRHAHAI